MSVSAVKMSVTGFGVYGWFAMLSESEPAMTPVWYKARRRLMIIEKSVEDERC